MDVKKIVPQGYCKGVLEALNIIKSSPKKHTYILGQIIHNKNIVESLNNEGFITLEGKTRFDMIDDIPCNSNVVFTAHGVSPSVREKCLKKNLNIIDATCKRVLEIHNIIISKIKEGKKVIYIGKKNHPETEGVLGINNQIFLFDDLNNPPIINEKDSYFVTNQTTLSLLEIKKYYDILKYENVEINNSICNATTIRQERILTSEDCDLFIVVGDYCSSNTNELYNVAKKRFNTIKIESIEDLDITLLKDVKKVLITSGASTPKKLVDQIYDYLVDFDYSNPKELPKKEKNLL